MSTKLSEGFSSFFSGEKDLSVRITGFSISVSLTGISSKVYAEGINPVISVLGAWSTVSIGTRSRNADVFCGSSFGSIFVRGDDCKVSVIGSGAQIRVTGKNAAVSIQTIIHRTFSLGEKGVCSVMYETRNGEIRFAVGIVGDNIKPYTNYLVNREGEFVETNTRKTNCVYFAYSN